MRSSTKTGILITLYSFIIILLYYLVFVCLLDFEILLYVACLEATGSIMLLIWNFLPIKQKTQIGTFLFRPFVQGEGLQTKAWNSIAFFIMAIGAIVLFLLHLQVI